MDASVVSHVLPRLDIADYLSRGWSATNSEIEQSAPDVLKDTVLT
ncbi:MAG: hypothetical protein ACR2OV_14280 [Hyphomicrobiaceae bacterium]